MSSGKTGPFDFNEARAMTFGGHAVIEVPPIRVPRAWLDAKTASYDHACAMAQRFLAAGRWDGWPLFVHGTYVLEGLLVSEWRQRGADRYGAKWWTIAPIIIDDAAPAPREREWSLPL